MIQYADFEAAVQRHAPNEFGNWRHLLPAVPIEFRGRFLRTLEHGLNLTTSFDYVMRGRTLPEEDYRRMILDVGKDRSEQEDLQSQLLSKLMHG